MARNTPFSSVSRPTIWLITFCRVIMKKNPISTSDSGIPSAGVGKSAPWMGSAEADQYASPASVTPISSDIGTCTTSGTSCSDTCRVTARSIATGITITLITAVHAASTINAASTRSTPTSSVYPAANTDCTA